MLDENQESTVVKESLPAENNDVKPALHEAEFSTCATGELRSCRTNLVGIILILIACGLGLTYMLSSCTISVNCVSTKGSADDLIQEDQSPTNDVKPELTIPAKVI